MAALKYFVVAFAACIGMALANSAGAPIDACQDLTPQHGVDAQKSAYPYSLNAAANKVTRGKEITVTLRGNGPQDKIKGFLIQARDGTLPIGQFRVVDRTKSQLLQCNSQGDTITHKKIVGDVTEVTFQWIAPRDFNGQVNFVGTVALNGGTFWNTLRSDTLTVA